MTLPAVPVRYIVQNFCLSETHVRGGIASGWLEVAGSKPVIAVTTKSVIEWSRHGFPTTKRARDVQEIQEGMAVDTQAERPSHSQWDRPNQKRSRTKRSKKTRKPTVYILDVPKGVGGESA